MLKLLWAFLRIALNPHIANKEVHFKKAIYFCLRDMGGVYIKFLQILCLTNDFLKGWGGPSEYEVFSQSPAEPLELSRYLDLSAFRSVEVTPFATGSYALIFRAELQTGEPVIIKVLRPSVRAHLHRDLRRLGRIVRFLSLFLPRTIIDYRTAFAEFADNTLAEIDYAREVTNLRYFAETYRDHPYVVIPQVYPDYCNEHVIVEQFISGPTLADIMMRAQPGEDFSHFNLPGSDFKRQLEVIGGEALRMSVMEDFIFGDPHPGNIILLPDNKFAFIDFGLMVSYPGSREAFYLWLKAYHALLNGGRDFGELLRTTMMCFCPDLLNALENFPEFDYLGSVIEALYQKLDRGYSAGAVAGELLDAGHLFRLFNNYLNQDNILGIKFDSQNVGLFKAMIAYLSSVTTLADQQTGATFADIVSHSMEYVFDACESSLANFRDYNYSSRYSLGESYEIILQSLSTMAEGDELMFNQVTERISI